MKNGEKNDFINFVICLCIDLEHLTEDNSKELQNGSPCFLYNQTDEKWKYRRNGIKLEIPTIFNHIYHRNLDNILWGFHDLLKNNQIDKDTLLLYQHFKNTIFNFIKKNMTSDAEEEKNNRIYMTYEMTVNISRFLTYHMICLHHDNEFLNISTEEQFKYQYSFSLIEYFCQHDSQLNIMRYFLAVVIEKKYDRTEYNIFLDIETRKCLRKIITEFNLNKLIS